MTRRRTAQSHRPAKRKRRAGTSPKGRRARFRLRPVRRLRSLTRKARRAARRRMRRTWRRSLRRYATWRKRQLARKTHAARQRQAATEADTLAARSITGKPRPAKSAAPSAAPAGGTQTTKRTRDGKFNGSTSSGKKTAAKKTVAKKAAVPAAQRDLARGDATLRRVEARLQRTERRIDRL